MEAVRTIGGVRFPVLTPNLKVNIVHSIGMYYYFMVLLYIVCLPHQYPVICVHHSSGI